MTINANLIAQVQARLNVAGAGNTLEELWNLKLIARGLGCDESNINTLITLRINEMNGSTELKSLLQAAIATRPYAQNIVRKSIEILTSQDWTAPPNLAGNTALITASSGGGGGKPWASNGFTRGACGGNFCVKKPVIILPSSTHSAVIGAGGAPEAQGNTTSFGSLLSLPGGSPAVGFPATPLNLILAKDFISMIGVKSAIYATVNTGDGQVSLMSHPPESAGGFTGLGVIQLPLDAGYASGPACGYFGNPNANAAAPNNTGAGGGANNSVGFNGGSGKMIIEWDEYQ